MMWVAPGEHPHMQGDACMMGEALEDVAGERPHVAAPDDHVRLALGLAGVGEVGTAGHVNHRPWRHMPAPYSFEEVVTPELQRQLDRIYDADYRHLGYREAQ